ncbi:hypothetical protein C5167_047395 [Papaver somniferum]|uniref:Uncharacterized protein n=1 Tax=Papaver somniferum TaxID=3469 RepID=A0A4Y7LKB3_PAPSO|nr:hypothetical protein C5167_047395 [Papaver somniferum]
MTNQARYIIVQRKGMVRGFFMRPSAYKYR